MSEVVKLNFGCGLTSPSGWTNYDSSFRVYVDRLILLGFFGYNPKFGRNVKHLDASYKLPHKDCSVDFIYSSHMIEHLYHEDAINFLNECYRILKPNGRIRLLTPNLANVISNYQNRRNIEDFRNTAADSFISWLGIVLTHKPKLLDRLLFILQPSKNFHLWLYDEFSLKKHLEIAGFKNIISINSWRSDFPDLDVLDPKNIYLTSLCAEGIK